MEANTPNGMENHHKKSKQKVECTDNGHNRCLGGDAEECLMVTPVRQQPYLCCMPVY